MADKVKILDADGIEVEIASDDAGAGGQVQIIKLAIATDGSATLIPADADGLKVKQDTFASFKARIEGKEAADGPTTGLPISIGGRYKASPPKVDADNDLAYVALTQDGKLLDIHSAPGAAITNINESYASAQTNHQFTNTPAPGANKRLVVTEFTFSRDVGGTMTLVQDPGGTPAAIFGPHYFGDNGGVALSKLYIPVATNKGLGITTTVAANCTITLRAITENV